MTVTLATARGELRVSLNESSAHLWQDTDLNTWINEGCRDIARRLRVLQARDATTAVVAGTQDYSTPADFLNLDRAEYIPSGSNQPTYPLQLTTLQELDQVWGINPSSQSSYPRFLAFYASPPNAKMRLYPVPSQSGTLVLYYWRLPALISADGTALDILEGWYDLVLEYAEAKARRKDRDPTWRDIMASYEAKLSDMEAMTRELHDQQKFMMTASGSLAPSWLTGADGWW